MRITFYIKSNLFVFNNTVLSPLEMLSDCPQDLAVPAFETPRLSVLSLRLTVLPLRLTVLSLRLTVLSLRLTVLSLRLTVLSLRLTVLSPLEILSDCGQALAVTLLQVPRHSPTVGELHIAEFTTKLFAIL